MADRESRKVYDFYKLEQVQKDLECRVIRSDIKSDSKTKRKFKIILRDQLQIGVLVLILAERLKKKDAPGKSYKSTLENRPLLTRMKHLWLKML